MFKFIPRMLTCGVVGQGGGAPAWTPMELSPTLWLPSDERTYEDTSKSVPAVTNGAAVNAWVGRTANGTVDFLKDSAANTPTIVVNALGGVRAVQFEQTSAQYLIGPGGLFSTIAPPFSFFQIAKGGDYSVPYVLAKENSFLLRWAGGNSPSILPRFGASFVDSPYLTVSASEFRWFGITVNSDLDIEFYYRTHLKAVTSGNAQPVQNSSPVYLGARNATQYQLDGQWCDFLALAAKPTPGDLAALLAYYNDKYSLNWWDGSFDPDGYKSAYAVAALTIPTYDGSGQAMHPSVVRVPGGWNGYEYWMVMTPYPGADSTKENPSIVASNDKATWVEPAGITNPIEPAPGSGGENSDPNLWFDESASTMYCVWRKATDEHLFYLKSTDGVNWTNKTTVISGVSGQFVCPSLIHDGSQFVLITHNNALERWEKRTSNNISGPWSDPIVTEIPHSKWHTEIKYVGGEYVMFPELWISPDGVVWNDKPLATVFTGLKPSWMAAGIYKGSGVRNDDGTFAVWYSGHNGSNVWNTGYSELVAP